ncbi:MAG: dUTP diphosphatase [Acutalibacteraceae bacterium]|nr:dUTP diphosphatase [Bacillota bacterium]
MKEISIKKVRPQAILPRRATPGSAGMDVCACITEPYTLQPGERGMIPAGFALAVPEGWAGFLFARSGLGTRKGIALSNGVGVIDSDYRGEVCVGLCNFSGESYTISPGDRIAQLVVMPVWMGSFREVDSLEETVRGENGFGSTGVR